MCESECHKAMISLKCRHYLSADGGEAVLWKTMQQISLTDTDLTDPSEIQTPSPHIPRVVVVVCFQDGGSNSIWLYLFPNSRISL